MEKTGINLSGLVLSRVFSTAIFMTYPACLSSLRQDWAMTAAEAGVIQGVFSVSFAISLLGTSVLCDRIGARRVFIYSNVAAALTALMFAGMARNFETGLVLLALVGFFQGGTYTPGILIAASNAPVQRKNLAVGLVLGGMSGGYVLSIFLSSAMLAWRNYEAAFLATAFLTIPGMICAYLSVRGARDIRAVAAAGGIRFTARMRRQSRLLTLGYIGHCWELFGMWAWIPAFLAAALLTSGQLSGVELGLWTAVTLHLSGVVASFLSGYLADRFGTKPILVLFAFLGLGCSATIGWIPEAGPLVMLLFVAVYGFATIGDSAVLSSAMTDAVPPDRLGKVLGIRSITGIGAGALSPVTFGMALDAFPGSDGWGIGFSTLALGGLVASVTAVLLDRRADLQQDVDRDGRPVPQEA